MCNDYTYSTSLLCKMKIQDFVKISTFYFKNKVNCQVSRCVISVKLLLGYTYSAYCTHPSHEKRGSWSLYVSS